MGGLFSSCVHTRKSGIKEKPHMNPVLWIAVAPLLCAPWQLLTGEPKGKGIWNLSGGTQKSSVVPFGEENYFEKTNRQTNPLWD